MHEWYYCLWSDCYRKYGVEKSLALHSSSIAVLEIEENPVPLTVDSYGLLYSTVHAWKCRRHSLLALTRSIGKHNSEERLSLLDRHPLFGSEVVPLRLHLTT